MHRRALLNLPTSVPGATGWQSSPPGWQSALDLWLIQKTRVGMLIALAQTNAVMVAARRQHQVAQHAGVRTAVLRWPGSLV